jgi:hypothetical protein
MTERTHVPTAVWVVGCLLVVTVGMRVVDVYPSFPLYFFMPLLAGWASRIYGPRVLLPLAVLGVLPFARVSLEGGFSFAFGIPKSWWLLSMLAGLALARPDGLAELVRVRARWLAYGALAWWALAAMDFGQTRISLGDGKGLMFDVLTIPAVLVIALLIRWGSLAAILGLHGRFWRVLAAAYAAVLVVELVVQMRWKHVQIGDAAASSLVPIACFWLVGLQAIRFRWVAVALACCAAIKWGLFRTTGSIAAGLLEVQGAPETQIWNVFLPGLCAALVGRAFATFWRSGSFAEAQRRVAWTAVGLTLAVLLGALFYMNRKVGIYGAGIPLLCGISLIAAHYASGRHPLLLPLFIQTLVVAAAFAFDERVRMARLFDALTWVAFATFPYAMVGFLMRDRRERAGRAVVAPASAPSGLVTVDIGAVAEIVQRIDRAAVLRSFGALLVPLLAVVYVASQVGAMRAAMEFFGRDPEALMVIATIAVIGIVGVLAPCGFIVADWIDRQQHLRWIACLTGSFYGVLACVAVAATFCLAPEVTGMLDFDDTTADRVAGGVGALFCAAVLGAGAFGRSRRARMAFYGLAALSALLALGAVALTGWLALREAPGLVVELAAFVAFFPIVGWLAARAVRLRIILAEDRPRDVLYGALGKGFWVRMAALMGLPSSMWKRRALRSSSTWVLLVARPVVYLAALAAKVTLGGAAFLLIAGHAVFAGGKRLAARAIWQPDKRDPDGAPILFLRGFDDDRFDFRRPQWQLPSRWFDLWAFRRNADEALVDEVAKFGPVVALGRPGEAARPFGALRHYSSDEAWKDTIVDTARQAGLIVLAAGDSPGLQWEIKMLGEEKLLPRTLVLFNPDPARDESNLRTLERFVGADAVQATAGGRTGQRLIALLPSPDGPLLLTAPRALAAAYVVALRAMSLRMDAAKLASAM